jgi:acid phosphatase
MRFRLVLALLFLLVLVPVAWSAPAKTPRFGRVVVIVMENKEANEVVGQTSAPTFASLAKRYASLTNYHGVAHPSLPNYLALVSGSTQGITDDCTGCQVDAPNLADTLAAAHKSWTTYAEALPSVGFAGATAERYAKKHNPLVYFRDVATNARRMQRIVPLTQLTRDLSRGQLPVFSLVVPDMCHSMHDCSVEAGDYWLGQFLPALLRSKQLAHGVVFVVFDEGATNLGGGGHVPALVLGPLVRPGAESAAPLDHYSLLRTVEDGLGLRRLGHSTQATPIRGIWK